MAEKLNATCSICGTKYHVCNDCSNTKSFAPWKRITCSTDCYKIFLILSNYTNKYISKDEAKKELSECNISNLESFEDNIKSSIKEIMKETKQKKTKNVINENVAVESESKNIE